MKKETGENPYAFGIAGGTDLHNGLSDTRESTYRGPGLAGDLPTDVVKRLLGQSEDPNPVIPIVATGSGGLTGIWAQSNTREALYDAMRRRETFATSGTRISLRVFGGWGFGSDSHGGGFKVLLLELWIRGDERLGYVIGHRETREGEESIQAGAIVGIIEGAQDGGFFFVGIARVVFGDDAEAVLQPCVGERDLPDRGLRRRHGGADVVTQDERRHEHDRARGHQSPD